MVAEMLLEAFAPMVDAYKRIGDLEAMLKVTTNKELRSILVQQQNAAVDLFTVELDREVDNRLIELMEIARQELTQTEQERERQARQSRHRPQVVLATVAGS